MCRISDEVIKNIKMFNTIFEKNFVKVNVLEYPDYTGKKNTEFKDIDEEFLTSILMYIDIDKLRIDFFKNPELIERLEGLCQRTLDKGILRIDQS